MLTVALLDALADRWRLDGRPDVDRLGPGLSTAEMEVLASSAGVRLPAEAQTYWGWHDAGTNEVGPILGGIGWHHVGLAHAVRETRYFRELFRDELGREMGEAVWPETLLVLAMGGFGSVLVIDCSDPTLAPTHDVIFSDAHPPGRPYAGSLAEMVARWIRASEQGIGRWDHTTGSWRYDWTRADPEHRL